MSDLRIDEGILAQEPRVDDSNVVQEADIKVNGTILLVGIVGREIGPLDDGNAGSANGQHVPEVLGLSFEFSTNLVDSVSHACFVLRRLEETTLKLLLDVDGLLKAQTEIDIGSLAETEIGEATPVQLQVGVGDDGLHDAQDFGVYLVYRGHVLIVLGGSAVFVVGKGGCRGEWWWGPASPSETHPMRSSQSGSRRVAVKYSSC